MSWFLCIIFDLLMMSLPITFLIPIMFPVFDSIFPNPTYTKIPLGSVFDGLMSPMVG